MTDEARPAGSSLIDELHDWLAANWDPELTVGQWWERLGMAGWSAPTWPEAWFGKGASRDDAAMVARIITDHGAVGAPAGLGLLLAGPTIVAHGSDEQRARLLPDIACGRRAWCQLFSEPGAGSDLAAVAARAERDGDTWLVNGQKVWTSGAQQSDLGMLLVRTNPDAPKHAGMSYFAIAMDQPGIDIRPLREMTGRALFNEVFLTDARVDDTDLLGGLHNGWAVANTTLANERAGLGAGGTGAMGSVFPGTKAGMLDRRVGDFARPRRRTASGSGGGGRAAAGPGALLSGAGQFLLDTAKGNGAHADPVVRQDLMRLLTLNKLAELNRQRAKDQKAAAVTGGGTRPGGEANLAKLSMSRIMRLSRDLGLRILGPGGMLSGPTAPAGGMLAELALFAPAVSIYGGTDEIQKNIVGERVLGLPAEPRPDKAVPFRDTVRQPIG